MPAPPRFLQELRGSVRLAVDGVKGVTNIVEAVHGSVARVAPVLGAAKEKPLGGITGLVYRSISGTTGLVGIGLDRALGAVEFVLQAVPRARGAAGNDETLAPQRDAIVSALNGVLGDHLERTANPLAMTAQLLRRSPPGPRPLLLVHGLCMNEQRWKRREATITARPWHRPWATARSTCATNTGRHVYSERCVIGGMPGSRIPRLARARRKLRDHRSQHGWPGGSQCRAPGHRGRGCRPGLACCTSWCFWERHTTVLRWSASATGFTEDWASARTRRRSPA